MGGGIFFTLSYLFSEEGVSASQTLRQWESLRHLVPETGYWPVIGWDRFKQPSWEEIAPQDIVEAGEHVDIQRWFEQQWLEHGGESLVMSATREARDAEQAPSPFGFRLHRGRFSDTAPPLVPIALIPTVDCWEVPAYLPTQTNEWDPPDAVHVALLKYWNERWKAELVSMVPGVVEMRVLQPPTTFEEALGLAKEQFLYAPDLVAQDLGGSINTLARILLNGRVWYFWWD